MLSRLLISMLLFPVAIEMSGQSRLGQFMVFNEQEIPAFTIRRIYEDRFGFLWIATKNGLFRYDGFQYAPYYSRYDDSSSLSSNSINDLQEDSEGYLWISTSNAGVVRMNMITGDVKQYRRLTADSNPTYGVNDIFLASDSSLWFATGGRGIVKYLPGQDRFEQYVLDPNESSDGSVRFQNETWRLAEDPEDSNIIWVAGLDGLFRFDRRAGNAEKFQFNRQGKPEWEDNSFHCIYIRDPEHIWLGTWGGGLVCFDARKKNFRQYLPDSREYGSPQNPKNIILDISPQNDSVLLLASAGMGLTAFHCRTFEFQPLISTDALPKSTFYALSINRSRDGSYWVGGENCIIHSNPVYNRFPRQIDLAQWAKEGNTKFAVVLDGPASSYYVAMAGQRELLLLDSNQNITGHLPVRSNTAVDIIHLFLDQKGDLFAVSRWAPYLFYYHKGMHALQPYGNFFPGSRSIEIYDALWDVRGILWLAANDNAIYEWHNGDTFFTRYSIPAQEKNPGNEPAFFTGIAADSARNLWLAGSAGLLKFDTRNNIFIRYFYSGRSSQNAVASAFLNAAVADDSGRIWIAPQYQGLQVFDPPGEQVIRSYSAGRGALASHIDNMTFDIYHQLWCTSNNGLLNFNPQNGQWKIYNTREGLIKGNLTGKIASTRKGSVFLGIDHWVYIFDAKKLPVNRSLPQMHITDFSVLGKPFNRDTIPGFRHHIQLSYWQNRIDISFTGIEMLYPDRLKFYYRLEGLDSTWKLTEVRRISFDNLKPGKYRFSVKAVNSDGFESRMPGTIDFVIFSPIWSRGWFILLIFLATTALLYAIYRFRLEQVIKLQRVKNRISADLHDELGSRLTTIQLLTQITRNQAGLSPGAHEQLVHIQEEAQASAEALHDIVTNIRLSDDRKEELPTLLRHYAAQVFEMTSIVVDFRLEDQLSDLNPRDEKWRDLVLIYKEALNNIRKHAGARRVHIETFRERQNIRLIIRDDGQGFAQDAHTGRNGLRIMRERTEKWHGHLSIQSAPGGGTTLELLLPVNRPSPIRGIFSRQ